MLSKDESHFSDEELIEQIRIDDETAFSFLYNRYWDKLYSVAYHRLSDGIEAEEVVQDLFLSIWARRKDLDIQSTVAGYLSVSIKYQIINKFARRKQFSYFKEKTLKSIKLSEETTDLWMAEKELKDRLEKYINLLPEKCRIVFKMSREEGKKNKEISQELNLAEKTIEAHISKALKVLRSNFPFIFIGFLFWLFNK